MLLIDDADGPTSIAGVMGGARSEVEAGTTRVLMEVGELERPQHPPHLAAARPAQRGLGPLREAAPARAGDGGPGGRDAADDRAVRRARCCPARSTSAARARTPVTIRLRDARVTGLLGAPIPRARSAEILERARVRASPTPPTGSTSPCPSFRRADVTREADLIEEVARLDGLEKLPATLPSRHGASGRLTAAPAAAPARRRRAHRPGPARDRRLELRRARARRPAAAAATTRRARRGSRTRCRPSSRELRTTLLGLAARRRAPQPRARRRRRCGCSRPAPSTCPSGGRAAAARAPPPRRRC